MAIAERALAAMQTKADPHADIFEEYDPRLPKGAIEAGLWTDFSKAGLSNYSPVNPLTYRHATTACRCAARRCCSATTRPSSKPADAPKTWDDLVAWIKANPGQFIYCRPDKGGSGNNFVHRAVYQANGLDPDAFTRRQFHPGESQGDARPRLGDPQGHRARTPSARAPTPRATPSRSSSCRQNAVTMITAWSDHASWHQSSRACCPRPPASSSLTTWRSPGGFAHMRGARQRRQPRGDAEALRLRPQRRDPAAGRQRARRLPGVNWDYLPPEMQRSSSAVIAKTMPNFPGGDWTTRSTTAGIATSRPNVDRNG